MIGKFLVLGPVDSRTITAKSGKNIGKEYTFNTLNVIDSAAPGQLQKVLQLEVRDDSVVEANQLAGKSVDLQCFISDGKYYYGGRPAVASVPLKSAVNS